MAKSHTWSSLIFVEIVVAFLIAGFFIYVLHGKVPAKTALVIPSPTITSSPTPFATYTVPTIPKKDYYRIVMVGDSMTEALGIHGGKVSEDLNTLFHSTPGHQRILIDNYAKGGTNITQLNAQMTAKDKPFPSLLSTDFDMILIESCGYNPLSNLGVDKGLQEQTKDLTYLVQLLIKTHPTAAIVFVATIAPNKETYAEDEGLTTVEARTAEANERISYIKNHIAFAANHNIPLIDIFSKSLSANGDGNIAYINPTDHIHPSVAGIDFISSEIATNIYQGNILPK